MEREIWKDVVGWETFYAVSSFGRLKRLPVKIKCLSRTGNPIEKIFKERIRKAHKNRDGYLYTGLTKSGISKTLKIHRLVAEAFLPVIKGKPHIDHIDGNKHNNNVSNLRWCTHSENITFGWATGAYNNIGSLHGNAVLNENIVKQIKIKIASGETLISLAKQYSVSSSTISCIKTGKLWKHVLLSA